MMMVRNMDLSVSNYIVVVDIEAIAQASFTNVKQHTPVHTPLVYSNGIRWCV